MREHRWGDPTFDWHGLYEAELLINTYCRRRGVQISTKEKYSTIRYELWPHWMCPAWYYKVPLAWQLAYLWRRFILRRALFKAVMHYPHLEDHILFDAPEDVVGEEIYSRYWKKL